MATCEKRLVQPVVPPPPPSEYVLVLSESEAYHLTNFLWREYLTQDPDPNVSGVMAALRKALGFDA